jgi:hypothetical protein
MSNSVNSRSRALPFGGAQVLTSPWSKCFTRKEASVSNYLSLELFLSKSFDGELRKVSL